MHACSQQNSFVKGAPSCVGKMLMCDIDSEDEYPTPGRVQSGDLLEFWNAWRNEGSDVSYDSDSSSVSKSSSFVKVYRNMLMCNVDWQTGIPTPELSGDLPKHVGEKGPFGFYSATFENKVIEALWESGKIRYNALRSY